MKEIIEKVKQELRPDTSILVEVELFAKEINKEIKDKGEKAVCVAGGSVAKGTFIKGDFDADLFVKFKEDGKLSDRLEKILEKFSAERVHGSRDYFQLRHDKIRYEIVPVLDIRGPKDAKNVTDMSPLHVEWVNKNIREGQKDEIRVAKQFCKAQGVYGAESYIKGFSGHVIDILIIQHGSFIDLLNAARRWEPKVLIDPEKYYRNKTEALFNINQSKLQGPMIVVDPIDKTRNAASALSHKKFRVFKEKAMEFLKEPDDSFFLVKQMGKTELKSRFKDIYT